MPRKADPLLAPNDNHKYGGKNPKDKQPKPKRPMVSTARLRSSKKSHRDVKKMLVESVTEEEKVARLSKRILREGGVAFTEDNRVRQMAAPGGHAGSHARSVVLGDSKLIQLQKLAAEKALAVASAASSNATTSTLVSATGVSAAGVLVSREAAARHPRAAVLNPILDHTLDADRTSAILVPLVRSKSPVFGADDRKNDSTPGNEHAGDDPADEGTNDDDDDDDDDGDVKGANDDDDDTEGHGGGHAVACGDADDGGVMEGESASPAAAQPGRYAQEEPIKLDLPSPPSVDLAVDLAVDIPDPNPQAQTKSKEGNQTKEGKATEGPVEGGRGAGASVEGGCGGVETIASLRLEVQALKKKLSVAEDECRRLKKQNKTVRSQAATLRKQLETNIAPQIVRSLAGDLVNHLFAAPSHA